MLQFQSVKFRVMTLVKTDKYWTLFLDLCDLVRIYVDLMTFYELKHSLLCQMTTHLGTKI